MRILLVITAFIGLSSVALGAYLEHSISDQPEEMIKAARTGLRYHQIYVPILLALCLYGLTLYHPTKILKASIILFMAGLVIFSGSLYAYLWTGIEIFSHVTPIGGLILMIGWGVLFIEAVKTTNRKT